jgi:transcription antitermination factor NusG
MGEALPERTPMNQIYTQDTDANWYAAYTMPRHEKLVANQLKIRQVETYLPVYRAVRNWNGRRAQVDVPLFQGYVFVRMPIGNRVKVLEQPGVVRLVGTNGKAAAIPDEEIERLRMSLVLCKAEPYPFLVPGKKVRIKSGPMTGFEGKILRRKSKMRLVVSLDLIQRSIVFELDAESAQAVT